MHRLFVCLLLAFALGPAARAAEAVDLLLVFAADVSRSVDGDKFKLQREGYAAAFADRHVLDVIRSGRNGRIAVLFEEWSGFGNQKIVIDWTLIDGAKAAQSFGDRLLESPRSFADRTSISGGIDFAVAQFAHAPFTAERRAIDVSGDGTNNSGRAVTDARDQAIASGVTINGLAIINDKPNLGYSAHTQPPGGLPLYYRQNVIGGPNAFLIVVQDFNSFADAMANKLAKEIDVAGGGGNGEQVSSLE